MSGKKVVLLLNKLDNVEGSTVVDHRSEWLFAEVDLASLNWSRSYLFGYVSLPILARRVGQIMSANAQETLESSELQAYFESGNYKLMSFRPTVRPEGKGGQDGHSVNKRSK